MNPRRQSQAGRSMVVIACPVINSQGRRLGTAAEWHDRAEEVMAETEVAAIVEASAQGDVSRRLDIAGLKRVPTPRWGN